MKKYIFKIIALITIFTFTGCSDLFYEPVSDSEISMETAAETEIIKDTESIRESETETATEKSESETSEIFDDYSDDIYVEYHFRTKKQLEQHFEKHGSEFEDDFYYITPKDYESGASDVINNPDALYKTEAEDGDGVYYIEDTNEFVILSTDGYIRTYFRPNAGIDYFNRQ